MFLEFSFFLSRRVTPMFQLIFRRRYFFFVIFSSLRFMLQRFAMPLPDFIFAAFAISFRRCHAATRPSQFFFIAAS